MRRSYSTEKRNEQLMTKDGQQGNNGRVRVRATAGLWFNANERVEFECLRCGSGRDGGWKMRFYNVFTGQDAHSAHQCCRWLRGSMRNFLNC
jgi:hypothetical protein